MAGQYVTIPKEMYLWAIERAGYNAGEFLKAHPAVVAYIEGTKRPTVKQLEHFAATVHVPMPFLMLPAPPVETSPIPMFRGKAGNGKFDLNVYQTILDIQGRQEWLSEYLLDNELDSCAFVGRYTIKTPIDSMAEAMREYLGLPVDWMLSFSKPEVAIKTLVERMEEAGVCVFFNGVVGNNTRRVIDVDECRGFALVGTANAPMIFVNNGDSKTAQMFTLAHEFAHVLVGFSAGFAGFEGDYHDLVESYCDSVAAEFVVPAQLLKKLWINIDDCAKRFNVSRLVIARRAHDLGLISDEQYREFYLRYRSGYQKKKPSSGGGSFYPAAAKKIGRLFAAHIYNAVRSRQLSYTEAYRLTGFYGSTFDKIMDSAI